MKAVCAEPQNTSTADETMTIAPKAAARIIMELRVWLSCGHIKSSGTGNCVDFYMREIQKRA